MLRDVCTDTILVNLDVWVALSIAAPHALYAFIWFKPQLWQKAFGSKAVDVFATCGALGKVLQFAAVLIWFGCQRPEGLALNPKLISLWQWLFFLLVGAYGQSLNYGIYQAIGKVGVYYGFKLGHKVPWVTGYPFDTISHPQYVGSVLSIWALAVLVCNQAPAGLGLLTVYWTSVYAVTGIWEQFC